MSVIIRNEYLTDEKRLKIIKRIQDEVHFRDTNYSMIVLVGEGIRHTKGLTAHAATAIARTDTNIEMINQGSSEVSLVFGIDKKDEDKVLRELYKEFFQEASLFV